SSCMSAVLYLRLPDAAKQALQARARERELSLNATVCELIEQALAAVADERASEELERKLAASTSELEQTRTRLAETGRRLQIARERDKTIARLQGALAERARHELASCPQCRKPLRGCDLLVSGHCPQCTRPITELLIPRPQTGAPDRDAYLALLGALGGLVGLALGTTSGRAD
ncbi:MAG: hypothetical protein ACRDNP_14890, partial [Gaiellaceae bacterium]